jgi:hypothetical protein
MTPEEKAYELYEKILFGFQHTIDEYTAKKCALIAVDEILGDDMYDMSEELFEKRISYWEEVKEEIEKL